MGRPYHARDLQESIDQRIAALAAAQHGVFTRAQAVERAATKDIIRWRVSTGRWNEMYTGVYCLAGTTPTGRQRLLAACFAWGPRAVASHRSAAMLWKIDAFEKVELIELTVPRGRRRPHAGHTVHFRPQLPRADVTVVDAIPVTTPTRTIVDLAGVVSHDTIEEILDESLRRRLTTIPRLRWQLGRLTTRGREGIGVVRALLDARDPSAADPESALETRLARILKTSGLKGLVVQYEIRVNGEVVARVDFAFPAARLAIEADGYRWHSGKRQWEHDLARRNLLTDLGWRMIHVTWSDLEKPQAVIDKIERALRSRLLEP